MSNKINKNKYNELFKKTDREKEHAELFKLAIINFNNKEYKSSYNSFNSIAYYYYESSYKILAKYLLALLYKDGLGITRNLNEAKSLYIEVSENESIHKKDAEKILKNW
ncbi:20009_t:CDS:1, partial [Gigaspora margarita]